jgi:hypothetical protein
MESPKLFCPEMATDAASLNVMGRLIVGCMTRLIGVEASLLGCVHYIKSEYQLQPLVLPHVSHFMHVPFRTSVKLPHSPHISPS